MSLLTPTAVLPPSARHPVLDYPPGVNDWGLSLIGGAATWSGPYNRPPAGIVEMVFSTRWAISASFGGGGVSYSTSVEMPGRGVSFIDDNDDSHLAISITTSNLNWSAPLGLWIPHVFVFASLYDEDAEEGGAGYSQFGAGGTHSGITLEIAGASFPTFASGSLPLSGSIYARPIEWEIP